MGFGKKKSSPPAKQEPVVTENNEGVPDDEQRRGVPLRDTEPAAASEALLKRKSTAQPERRMLY